MPLWALIGRLIFNVDFGVANWFLDVLGIARYRLAWIAKRRLRSHRDHGYLAVDTLCALIFLAGLSMVPGEIEGCAAGNLIEAVLAALCPNFPI